MNEQRIPIEQAKRFDHIRFVPVGGKRRVTVTVLGEFDGVGIFAVRSGSTHEHGYFLRAGQLVERV